jgi:hypothetical protein
LFSFFFLHNHSHVLLLCNSWNPLVCFLFSFSHDSCVHCCAFDIVGFGFCGFFFFSHYMLIVTFVISFYTFWGELPGHITNYPISNDSTVSW